MKNFVPISIGIEMGDIYEIEREPWIESERERRRGLRWYRKNLKWLTNLILSAFVTK